MTDEHDLPGWHSAWDDPNVKEALKERRPNDICLLCCERCSNYSYYNQGSHFCCAWCEWSVVEEDLDELLDMDGVITLEDYEDMQTNGEDVP